MFAQQRPKNGLKGNSKVWSLAFNLWPPSLIQVKKYNSDYRSIIKCYNRFDPKVIYIRQIFIRFQPFFRKSSLERIFIFLVADDKFFLTLFFSAFTIVFFFFQKNLSIFLDYYLCNRSFTIDFYFSFFPIFMNKIKFLSQVPIRQAFGFEF